MMSQYGSLDVASIVAVYSADTRAFDFYEDASGRWVGWLSKNEICSLGGQRTPCTIIGALCKEDWEMPSLQERCIEGSAGVLVRDLNQLCRSCN